MTDKNPPFGYGRAQSGLRAGGRLAGLLSGAASFLLGCCDDAGCSCESESRRRNSKTEK